MKTSTRELIEAFGKNQIAEGASKHTIRIYRGTLIRFFDSFKRPVEDIRKKDISDYLSFIRGRNVSDTTIYAALAAISSFYNYLNDIEDMHIENPAGTFLRRLGTTKRKDDPPILTIEEVALLIKNTENQRTKLIMLLLYKTGLRIDQELLRLKGEDIDFEKKEIYIKHSKGGESKTVFFDEECEKLLKEYLLGKDIYNPLFISRTKTKLGKIQRLGYQSPTNAIKKEIKKSLPKYAGKEFRNKITPHTFRHWFTTHLLKAGARREVVQRLRGDSSRDTIDIYTHISKEELKAEYLKYIPKLGL